MEMVIHTMRYKNSVKCSLSVLLYFSSYVTQSMVLVTRGSFEMKLHLNTIECLEGEGLKILPGLMVCMAFIYLLLWDIIKINAHGSSDSNWAQSRLGVIAW